MRARSSADRAKDGETRFLPISPRLRAVLDMVKLDPNGELHPGGAFVFGDASGDRIADPEKSRAKACRAAAIQGLRFHDLRHEAGSRLLDAGWPLAHVRDLPGHANIATTSTYLNVTRTGLRTRCAASGTAGRPRCPSLHTKPRRSPGRWATRRRPRPVSR